MAIKVTQHESLLHEIYENAPDYIVLRAECTIHRVYSTIPILKEYIENDPLIIKAVERRLLFYLNNLECDCPEVKEILPSIIRP